MDLPQTLTIIGSILVPMLAGFGWIINRIDKKVRESEERTGISINRLATEIDCLRGEIVSLGKEVKRVEDCLKTELQSQGERLARIEGAIWSGRYTGTAH